MSTYNVGKMPYPFVFLSRLNAVLHLEIAKIANCPETMLSGMEDFNRYSNASYALSLLLIMVLIMIRSELSREKRQLFR